MKEIYHIFHANEYIGDLMHDTNGDKYEYISKSNSNNAKRWIKITNADKGPERFKETLLDTRVMSPDRIDCREILRRMSLYEYDPWKIMTQIHFTTDDMFWGHKDMVPDWFWYNHPLASWHPNYTKITGKPMYSQVLEMDDTTIY